MDLRPATNIASFVSRRFPDAAGDPVRGMAEAPRAVDRIRARAALDDPVADFGELLEAHDALQ